MMEETQKNFIEILTRIETIHRAKVEAVQYWGEDIPITVLFGELGRAVVKNFDTLSSEKQDYIFRVIEQGMNSPNDTLSTAVATGLLEAISGQISKSYELAKRIDAKLGETSKRYLTNWEMFKN
jgi:hypothetical protein